MIGQPLRRIEDHRFLTGRATFVDDIRIPGMLYAAFLRSPVPHGRIRQLDTFEASQLPGVITVLTAKEVSSHAHPIPLIRRPPTTHAALPTPPILADTVTRYQGEPIALAIATSPQRAYDAVNAIRLEIDPLPSVAFLEDAKLPEAPLVHPSLRTNVAFSHRLMNGNAAAAFSQATIRIRQRMHNNRLVPNPMEPRGVVAAYDAGRRSLTCWFSTQRPHHTRWFLAEILGLPEHAIRIIMPDVGGAFGCKEPIYPDEVAVVFASLMLRAPVKWIETRSEHFIATTHGRDQLAELEIAADSSGQILGLRGDVWLNLGAYLYPNTAGVVLARTLPLLTGCYAIPAIDVTGYGVFTNTVPTGPYRGAGRPEGIYFIERLIDMVASALDLDPAEVRRRNFLPSEAFPFTTIAGLTYDSGNYHLLLDRALDLAEYEHLREVQKEARKQGRFLGIGIAAYVEIGGATPSSAAKLEGSPPLWESALVSADPSGSVTIRVGTAGHGQGHETAFAQIAASVLGLPVETFRVEFGDTATAPFGFGTFGTRSITIGGSAVYVACQRLLEQVKRVAAILLECAPEDVDVSQGVFRVRGMPERSVSFPEVCAAAHYSAAVLQHGENPGLTAIATFDPPNYTFAAGVHVAVVEVDATTGQVKLSRYVAVDDCGRAINPMIVEGQIHGGIVQGIGQALWEHASYTDQGYLNSASLLDYALPHAHHLPTLETALFEIPSPSNPLGAKGIGEGGAIVAPVAVSNAVLDALRPFKVTHLDMPHTPEQLWRVLESVRPHELPHSAVRREQ